jgi:hypothetical protein
MMASQDNRVPLSADRRERLRTLRVSRPIPAPVVGEPSDDDLLRYLDGAMSDEEQAAFEQCLAQFPATAARVEILREALEELDAPLS